MVWKTPKTIWAKIGYFDRPTIFYLSIIRYGFISPACQIFS
jgi:hypothetical protein